MAQQPKLHAEIPDIRLDLEAGTASVSATWDGFRFFDLAVRDLAEAPATAVQPQPMLYVKYVPRTGEWGTADACYVTLTPPESALGRVLRRWAGLGSVAFHSATVEQLPTLFHVVVWNQVRQRRHWRRGRGARSGASRAAGS